MKAQESGVFVTNVLQFSFSVVRADGSTTPDLPVTNKK